MGTGRFVSYKRSCYVAKRYFAEKPRALDGDYLRKSENFGGKFPKKGAETKQIFQSNAQVYSQTRKNFASNAQVFVRNVRKRLKIFEN